MADGGGSGNAAGLKETPVDDPFMVNRGPPDFTFASLPYVQEKFEHRTSVFENTTWFRMTSPYDCANARGTADINTGAGTANNSTLTADSSDSSIQSARWFNFYAGIYKYYHVVACKYKIFVENLLMEPLYAHLMFINDTMPSAAATNHDMMLWKGVRTHYLNPMGYAIDTTGVADVGFAQTLTNQTNVNEENANGGMDVADTFQSANNIGHPGSKIGIFEGVYRPGDFTREIRLDSEVENWTLCTTNPALPERLMLRLKPVTQAIDTNNATNYGDRILARVRVELDYLVEFKELKDGLQWPISRQPLTVTIVQNEEETETA